MRAVLTPVLDAALWAAAFGVADQAQPGVRACSSRAISAAVASMLAVIDIDDLVVDAARVERRPISATSGAILRPRSLTGMTIDRSMQIKFRPFIASNDKDQPPPTLRRRSWWKCCRAGSLRPMVNASCAPRRTRAASPRRSEILLLDRPPSGCRSCGPNAPWPWDCRSAGNVERHVDHPLRRLCAREQHA